MKRHSVFAILDNNKVFINLSFMHKLYWMKTEWDQARFSGLVKWFDPACAGRMFLKTSYFS